MGVDGAETAPTTSRSRVSRSVDASRLPRPCSRLSWRARPRSPAARQCPPLAGFPPRPSLRNPGPEAASRPSPSLASAAESAVAQLTAYAVVQPNPFSQGLASQTPACIASMAATHNRRSKAQRIACWSPPPPMHSASPYWPPPPASLSLSPSVLLPAPPASPAGLHSLSPSAPLPNRRRESYLGQLVTLPDRAAVTSSTPPLLRLAVPPQFMRCSAQPALGLRAVSGGECPDHWAEGWAREGAGEVLAEAELAL